MSYKDEFFSVLSQFNEYASEAIDKLGYGFLAECGYKVDKAIRYPNERRKLLKQLKADGVELRCETTVDREDGAICFWYALCKGKKVIKKSKSIRFEFLGNEQEDEA